MSARVQNLRDFPQTKLDSDINVRFLLMSMVTPTFYLFIYLFLFFIFVDSSFFNVCNLFCMVF